ncbi:MAG: HAD-IB family phosphatase [Deltaproteobacteria bacterium]|nr:HAD-IB family phosphatase [Deltaproteobacteria bacterium]
MTSTWLDPFPAAFRKGVETLLGRSGRRVACFDADDTLWEGDLGEAFLEWLARGGRIALAAPDFLSAYQARVRADRTAGYTWAVQVMAGLKEADVVRWSRHLAAAWPPRPAMAGLLDGLRHAGVETWIVSASNHWIVREAAVRLGVPVHRAIGIRVEVEGGRLTDRPVRPIPHGSGKAEAVQRYVGASPDLAAGDSLGDLEMLETARLPLVVDARGGPPSALHRIALARSWPVWTA